MLVSAASLLAASLLTACSQFTQTLTVDFVFVASARAAGTNNYGQIDVFEVNSESGAMRQIPSSPFPSGGRNPVAEAVSADNGSLFVVNHDDNTVVQFTIGSDGKIYQFNTVNTPGVFPLAVATSATNLFVVDTYEPLPTCSAAEPCTGSIAVYPLSKGTTATPAALGAPATNTAIGAAYWPLTLPANPTHIIVATAVNVVASGAYVYVTAYDSSVSPTVGYVYGYSVGSGGALTALSGSPYAAGTQPSAIASDAKSAYAYVTDFLGNDVLAYAISTTTGSTGKLVPLTTGTGGTNKFQAGNQPTSIVVDPSFAFAYVANGQDATVSAYSISNGTLTGVGTSSASTNTYQVGLEPVAIGVDPSTNHFLYTANYLGDNLSSFELSQTIGTLVQGQGSPFGTNQLPTALVAIPHAGTGSGISP
jgi:6-phosphogluconolactonase (cycloisomerase 2 family)